MTNECACIDCRRTKGMPGAPCYATPEDDLPTTSLSELDDAMGAAVLGVCLFVALLAAFVWVGWFIGRTRGAW